MPESNERNQLTNVRIQQLHKTAAGWSEFEHQNPNFIFEKGEFIVFDVDENYRTPRFKIGDGERVLSQLPFIGIEINFGESDTDVYIDAGRIGSSETNDDTVDTE